MVFFLMLLIVVYEFGYISILKELLSVGVDVNFSNG